MSYEYITDYNAVNYTPGREGEFIQYIMIHWWDDPDLHPTFEGVLQRFNNPASGVSAHYVVEAGRVACTVDCADTAYHAGDWYYNTVCIGIECNPRCWDSDVETVCELVADLFKVYGVLPIIGHKDVTATQCPGTYYDKLDYIYNRAIEIMNSETNEETDEEKEMDEITKEQADYLKNKVEKSTKKEPSKWAEKEWNKAIELGITDGTRPQDVVTREESIAIALRVLDLAIEHNDKKLVE